MTFHSSTFWREIFPIHMYYSFWLINVSKKTHPMGSRRNSFCSLLKFPVSRPYWCFYLWGHHQITCGLIRPFPLERNRQSWFPAEQVRSITISKKTSIASPFLMAFDRSPSSFSVTGLARQKGHTALLSQILSASLTFPIAWWIIERRVKVTNANPQILFSSQ